MVSVAARLIALPVLLGLAAAGPLTRPYEHGPIALDNRTTLHFTIDPASGLAHLALRVTDRAVFGAAATAAWLGLGVGEPTSGHMPGADIATAQFDPNATATCTLVDRHVPFAAHPLWVAAPDSPAVFPRADACQHDGSWILRSCTRDVATGVAVLELSRPLVAHDEQDRALGPGFQNVLYAYGGDFGYHGPARRSSTRLALYNDETTDVPVGAGVAALPADADGRVTLTATDYVIPSDKRTIYACTSRKVALKKDERLMVVATDPLFNSSNPVDSPVHHFLVFLCSSATYAAQFERTRECTTSEEPGINGPVGNVDSGCSTLIAAYAKGSKRQVFPPEAGVPVTEDEQYLLIETHYENTELRPDLRDSSGIEVYTATKPRTHEAGSLILGDIYLQMSNQPVQTGRKYEFTCPSTCLARMNETINVFGSFLHMHRTGEQIYTNRYTSALEHVETLSSVNFWNDKFQPATRFDPPKRVAPGDVLQTTCQYDASKTNGTTFGIGLDNEMCVNILNYWPRQRMRGSGIRLNVCSLLVIPGRGGTFTECGDSADFDRRTSIIWQANPAFTDYVGAPTVFGKEPDTCGLEQSPEPEPSPTEEELNGQI